MVDEASGGAAVQETVSDEMLAQLLQLQFDQEYDRALGKEEAKYNGTSKGKALLSILLCNFSNFLKFIQWVYHFLIIARFPREVFLMKIQIHLMMRNGTKHTRVGTVLK